MNKKEIAKIAKKILRQQQGLSDYQIMHPTREWWLGISIGVVIFIATTVWSASVYIKNRNAPTIESSASEQEVIVYRKSWVDTALQELKNRELALGRLLNSATQPEQFPETESAGSEGGEAATSSTEVTTITEPQEQQDIQPEAAVEPPVLPDGIVPELSN